ncbi:MAG TPA: hypothetical protein VGS97_22105 [Actinocrinis sp.]|nr:hypothetical protein [Actinocrinis sp.]
MKRFGALWNAASARLSHLPTTPAWRRIKFTADRVLLVAVLGAIGWTVVNGVFVAQRAATDRTQVLVRLGGPPTLGQSVTPGKESANAAPPAVVLNGVRSARIEIAIANDATDGVSLQGGTLTGPYLSGNTKLEPDNHDGYVMGHGTIHLVGTITVDCDAAAPVTHALVAGRQGTAQQVTNLTVTLTDTDGALHSVILTVDTTALAIQGRVCAR